MNFTELKHHIKDPLYRNSLFLMSTTAVTTGLGFFFWMVVARADYTEAEVGIGAAIISAIMLLSLISTLGLNIAIIRFFSKSKHPVEMINSCLTASGIAALVVSGIFLAGVDWWSPATHFVRDNIWFALAFTLFVLWTTLSRITGSLFIAKRRAEFTLIKSTIFSLLKIPLPILFVLFWHAFGIVSSWGFATGFALIISLFIFLPRIQKSYRPVPKLNLGIIKDIWKYSAGNYFAVLFASFPPLILPLIIINQISAEQNAYFYVAWMISSLLFAIPVAVSQSLFAEGSHSEEELAINSRRAFKFIVLLLIPAITLVILLGDWLLGLFGENYSSYGLKLLWILGGSSLFIGISDIYYSILRVRNRIRELILIRLLTCIVVLAVSSIIAPAHGIVGIGYVWIGVQVVVSIYVLLTVRSRLRAMRVQRQNIQRVPK